MVISVEEYRKILNDFSSTEEQIKKRLEFLEALCRNVAKLELENYVNKAKNRTINSNQSV
jgi:hypothetical protein